MIVIPTLQELYDDILTSLQAELNVTIPLVGKNFLRALAAVQAAKLWLFYKATASVQKNIFPDTADSVANGGTLERFGLVKLNRNPFPAVAAQYTVSVTGTTGGVIPASQTFKSDDDSLNPGMLFILDNEYTLPASTGSITVRALTTGLDSKLDLLDTLTSTSPIALVNSSVSVSAVVISPLDAETTEAYRAKVIEAYRLEAQGGAGADYRLWASEVQGVRLSYPFAKSGAANEINLYIEAELIDSVDGKGTPTAGILTAVEASVEDPTVDRPGRKPLGVFAVHYLPIEIHNVDIEIVGFENLTVDIQTVIQNEIEAYIYTVRPFIASIDVLANKNDILSVNSLIYQIQVANPASVFTGINLYVDSILVTSYQFSNGKIPYLNSITYV